MARYKALNEGRYTTLHDYTNLPFFSKAYFLISPTTLVLRRLLSLLNKYVETCGKDKLRILDIGCGGGIKDLTKYGEVYGVDISESSLRNAKKIYKKVIVSDLSKAYPFKDNYFDIVFCSEVYGHIARRDKEHFLSEVARVLKRNGFYLFSCETKGDNWLTRLLIKENKYKKLWIDHDGHIGLEDPTAVINRFKEHFSTVSYKVNNTYVFTLDELIPIFPILSLLFSRDMVRRLGNLLLAPFYFMSIRFYSIKSVNNILLYGKK